MTVELHPHARIQTLHIGRESMPLMVVDDLVRDPQELIDLAATKVFSGVTTYYPGTRAKAPLSYQRLILEKLRPTIVELFRLHKKNLRFTECSFSLVTVPGRELNYLQRIPHVDSLMNDELAMVHYLFRADYGGTAFYRHRATGFEYVDASRQTEYLDKVEAEKAGPHSAPPAYINGDTPLYECIASQEGVFNRLIMYRRTTLHSGSLAPGFVPDSNPRTGRLSINGFIA